MIYHDISGVPQFGIAKLVNFSFNHMAGFCGRFVSTSWDLNANKKNSGNHLVTIIFWLVVLPILKNMKVNGKDYPIYYGTLKK